MDPSCLEDSSSIAKCIHNPVPPFLSTFKKKAQAYVDKIRETSSQVKIDIPFFDAI